MIQKPTKFTIGERILQQLRHPLKLRLTICMIAILAWYLAVFMPIDEQTQTTTARMTRERKRITTARDIETLRKSLAPHLELIRAGADVNELMRHVIDHLRTSPLKLIDLKPEASKDLGPTGRLVCS